MYPNLSPFLHWGTVTAVHAGVTPAGKRIAAWLATVELTTGARVVARVIGPDRPRVSTPDRPSQALVGYVGGNTHDAVCWPVPWTAETRAAEFGTHQAMHEFERVAIHVHESGQVTIRSRGSKPSNDDDVWVLDAKPDPLHFLMCGGSRPLARARVDGALGDQVVIDAASSPQFAAWMTAADALLRALPGGGAMPALPLDVPAAVDGGEAPAAPVVGPQLVGEIVTGSQTVRGK